MIDKILSEVLDEGRKTLNEYEANLLLSSVGISMARTELCLDFEAALRAVESIGYPVVLKILSSDILHKTEAGCVRVGITNEEELKAAYDEVLENAKRYNPDARIRGVIVQEMLKKGLEVIFGVSSDPQFYHTIMFGMGGIYVEVFKDVSMRLVPISRLDAEDMISETKLSKILDGARGKNYDKNEVVDILLKISNLVKNHPCISEIDINPFLLYENGKKGAGVDALITLK
jgi:acetate---CoA ligase (ADP-forming) subunit beta